MSNKITVNILRAFVNKNGEFGNPTGVILDLDQKLDTDNRQKIATKLHFTDTVFINSLEPVNVSFFNPQQETKFAGDALLSTAYFIKNTIGKDIASIICKGGQIKVWSEGELTWLEASLDGTPGWKHQQLNIAVDVDSITSEQASHYEHTMVWAWTDKEKGLIRSRTFLPDWGTLEDQGNGSGSMQLAKLLGRKIEIHQGNGSVIYAQPSHANFAKVGGRVKMDTKQNDILNLWPRH
jgi:predicted PhzF superfamily epimerase YddE/YHI9